VAGVTVSTASSGQDGGNILGLVALSDNQAILKLISNLVMSVADAVGFVSVVGVHAACKNDVKHGAFFEHGELFEA
jgi:hypothetical protein